MDTEILQKWAELLLDTGKRNNLINFKDSKQSTVEVVAPDYASVFKKAEHSAVFEVYDPEPEDDETDAAFSDDGETVEAKEAAEADKEIFSKQNFVNAYSNALKKNQILVYNAGGKPLRALKNAGKKAKTALEETGVNIAYIAFGFVHWFEAENSQYQLRAPLLLVPVSIENRSAVEPYYVKVQDDEVVVNPTFAFKLQTDFGIKLPEYDEDEGIESYLNSVSELVSKLKWSVSRECKIGIFSFLKINMYKDLKENAEKIVKNESVRALLGEQADSFGVERNGAYDLLSLHNVVDADSSQAEAILAAKEGNSFVLQGPPGTGKSQTITNIIAECLADGKKVLFVSEKLAALNVVYDKLKKAGLEEFCLELHSHKANKKRVIDELCATLRTPKSGVSEKAEKQLKIMKEAQARLDEYAKELHKVRPVIEKTLYQLYDELSACRSAGDISFVIEDIKSKGESFIERAESLLNRYTVYVDSVGENYRNNAWFGFVNTDGSYAGAARLKEDLRQAVELCRSLIGLNAEVKEKLGVFAKSVNEATALGEFFALAAESEYITPQLFNSSKLQGAMQTAKRLGDIATGIYENGKATDEKFGGDIYRLDGRAVYKKLTVSFKGVIPRIFSGEYRKIMKELSFCAKNGRKLKYAEAVEAIGVLREFQEKTDEFEKLEQSVKPLLGGAYDGVNTDFDRLYGDLNSLYKTISAFGDLAALSYMPAQNYQQFKPEFKRLADCYGALFIKHGAALERLLYDFDAREYDVPNADLSELKTKFEACISSADRLDNWCDFVKLLNLLEEQSLRSFVDFAIENGIEKSGLVTAYKRAFYSQWIRAVLREAPAVSELARVPHDETISAFREKDVLNFEINKAKIKAYLSAQRPALDMVAQGSAVAILLREGEKKRKKKGIRQLLSETGELVQTLKPCFLMSPLSVSTFLGSDVKFDTVIFDEASQIFPQDAVGAIYRGKQLIVVGDSKQMPPSNFFNSTADIENDDESEDITDFESILDLCSASFTQRRLKWHYRSRFEQLIAFSNKNFYDNQLITFPSSKADEQGTGVDFFFTEGVFDRKSKTNRVEAEHVADLVFENIKKFPKRSLGVVAFSISQQNLIEKLIYKRRQQNAEFEEFFRSDAAEPFFVKNLETVQGDERDTIIFSVAYAKDAQGRLLLNFGPLNREGGERRLNVAVTRAKFNVQLVASMHCYDIDLSRTDSEGARLLREYLDYAENGGIALQRSVSANAFERYDSEFEMEVCEFLRGKGYAADTQVGASSFRIDIAVKRPESSDYVLAVECDGAAYHSSKTARDRDRLRQDILERMGWKFYRVWSTDWFRNGRVERERLLNAVNAALNCAPEKAVKSEFIKSETPVNEGLANEELESEAEGFSESVEEASFKFPEYKTLEAAEAVRRCGRSVLAVTRAIVEVESPVSEEWLLKRIVFLFEGREKVTNVVRAEFNRSMWNCQRAGIIRKDGFLYLQGAEIPMLRVPAVNGAARDIKYIELNELASGIKEILKRNVTAEKSGLFKLLAQSLGFGRIGEAIIRRMESALALIGNETEINGDMISLK